MQRVLQADVRAWAATVVLMLVNLVAWLDRSLPNILIEPIKHDFSLSDTQLALITGLAFSLCQATLTLPLSWLADRWDRVWLIALGILVWSSMTFASGYASGFGNLFLFRMGVGLGEAVLLPAAYALIADYFPPDVRPKALMVFVLGGPIGSALAFFLGGRLQSGLPEGAFAFLHLETPWRGTFALIGLAGVVVGLVTLLLPEPRRRLRRSYDARAGEPRHVTSGSVHMVLRYVREAAFFFVPFLCGATLYSMLTIGYVAWLAPFFARTYGWSPALIGSRVGLVTLSAGLIGAPLGAWAAVRLSKHRARDSVVRVLFLTALFACPLAAVAPLLPSGVAAYIVIWISFILIVSASAVIPAALVNGAPVLIRARVVAAYLFVGQFVASACGPTSYALATDYLWRNPARLNWSMALVAALLGAGAVILLRIADRRYDAVLRLAQSFDSAARNDGSDIASKTNRIARVP
jgi:MFS family permease